MNSRPAVPPELFWFLGVLGAHLLTCLTLFSLVWIIPDGPAARAVAALFDVLAYPEPLLSSFLWGAAIAAAVAVGRRVRGPA